MDDNKSNGENVMPKELDTEDQQGDDDNWDSCKKLINYQISQHTSQIDALSNELKVAHREINQKVDNTMGTINGKVDQLIKEFIEVKTAFNITVMGKGGIGGIIGSGMVFGIYLLIKYLLSKSGG